MRNSSEIASDDSTILIRRNLKIADWILIAVGIVVFAGGIMFLGPLKFAAAIVFLALVAIAFFSPKYGLYVLYGVEGLYVLVFYVNLMALAPTQLGLDYTISFYVEGGEIFIAPLMVLFVSYLLGFVARAWISKERYIATNLEKALIGFLLFCTAGIFLSIANELYPLIILTDIHVVLMLTFGIFAARSFKSIDDFRSLFNFLVIISLLHWIFLTGFFFQQKLYTELLFLMDLLRAIQGSSDLYSPFIPVMLAVISIVPEIKRTRLEKFYPLLVFLFSVRTILCLSRGAMLQVIISVIALYLFMPKEYKRHYLRQVKRQLVYAVVFCVLIFMISPGLAKTGFKLIASRAAESGSESTKQGSIKYRAFETQMVLENVAESPIFGFGPGMQTKKRMFTYTSASEEPYVHNGFLWYVLKFGIVGLVFLFYVLVRYYISFRDVIRGSPPVQKALLIGTAAGLTGILPIIVTNNVIAAVQGNIFISFVFGVVIFAEIQHYKSRHESRNDPA
jgi:hypothetical protein